MNVTVIGGGNIGTYFAVEFARKGHEVIVYSSKPGKFSTVLQMHGEEDTVVAEGEIVCSTNDLKKAVCNTELILITLPAFMLTEIAQKLYPLVPSGISIGVIPGTGGVEFCFSDFKKKDITIFGLQRVPAVARLVQYGKIVKVQGKRERLHLASIPNQNKYQIAEMISDIFEMPCECLDNYLCVTLTPSNPILHTARLFSLFEDYQEGKVYPSVPLFYEQWDDASSEILFLCDEELQHICKCLTKLDLHEVLSLKEHYGCNTVSEMTKKMQSIKSLQGLKTPMIECKNGYIPDFESRYFTADFPCGLAIIKQIADMAEVKVSGITKVLGWYEEKVPNHHKFLQLSKFGIRDLEDLYNIY